MHHADVVELVDTLDSGSSACKGMKVQVLSSALKNPVVRYRVFRFFLRQPRQPRRGYARMAQNDEFIGCFFEGMHIKMNKKAFYMHVFIQSNELCRRLSI